MAGLPFSNYGRDKLKLNDYYNRQNILDFSYEGEDYSVTIGKVIVCPQCYSAIASRLGNMKGDYLVVDIGSKTTDVVYVQTGKDIPEHEVMKILLKEESHLPIVYAELIQGMMREKICSLELEFAERGYDMDYTNLIYVGGGALIAEAAGSSSSLTSYVKRVLEEHFRIKMEITGGRSSMNRWCR